MSASHAEAPGTPAQPVLVWDLPVRVFHWLMALSFAGAWLTAESERWRLVHVTLGYTVMGLVAFRLVWGVIGTRHARFAAFVRGPQAVKRYVGSMLAGRAEHHTGHNPAGALAIVALLGLGLAVTGLGWAAYNDLGGEFAEEGHELAAQLMLAVVGVHLAGVVVGSWLHRENLVRAMVTGRKKGASSDAIRRSWAPLGALLLVAVLAFWVVQWRSAPVSTTSSTSATDAARTAAPFSLSALLADLTRDDSDGEDDDD
jgi:cytochrome b